MTNIKKKRRNRDWGLLLYTLGGLHPIVKQLIRENAMKYKTVEGYPIVRDGEYETRRGEKAVALGFLHNYEDYCIIGYIAGNEGDRLHAWTANGRWRTIDIAPNDLMRPWKDKKAESDNKGVDMQDLGMQCFNYMPSDKKVYRLNDMWKVWMLDTHGMISPVLYKDKQSADKFVADYKEDMAITGDIVLAITSADAISFLEGQGLE